MKAVHQRTVQSNGRQLPVFLGILILIIVLIGIFRSGRIQDIQDVSLVAVATRRQKDLSEVVGTGRVRKTISVIHFSSGGTNRTELLENAAYSLGTLAKTDNYIVAVLDSASLEVCLNTGLPCADASSLFGDSDVSNAETFMSPAYVETTWKKVRVVYELLKHGFSVHSSDYDVSYAPKDSLWKNYVGYITDQNADAAFQVEMAGINTGNYVILHSTKALRFMEQWLGLQGSQRDNDQIALNNALLSGESDSWKNVTMCTEECSSREDEFTIRRYYPPYWSTYHDHCLFNGQTDLADFDLCHPSVLYVHPICTGAGRTTDVKLSVFDSLGVLTRSTTTCTSSTWDPFYS